MTGNASATGQAGAGHFADEHAGSDVPGAQSSTAASGISWVLVGLSTPDAFEGHRENGHKPTERPRVSGGRYTFVYPAGVNAFEVPPPFGDAGACNRRYLQLWNVA